MKYEIRELGISAILDQSIKLIQDNFKLLFGIVLVLLVPYCLVHGFVSLAFLPAPPQNRTDEAVAAYYRAILAALPVLLPMFLILTYVIIPITNSALIHAIARVYLNQPTSVGQSFQLAVRRFLPMLGTVFVFVLALIGGLLLCLVPAIFVALSFALATQVVILEGLSGFAALKRSKELMNGNRIKLLILGVIVFLINVAVIIAAAFIPQPQVQTILMAFVQGVTTLFSSAAGVIFYFSARCKHENFDLKLLAESVGTADIVPEADADLL